MILRKYTSSYLALAAGCLLLSCGEYESYPEEDEYGTRPEIPVYIETIAYESTNWVQRDRYPVYFAILDGEEHFKDGTLSVKVFKEDTKFRVNIKVDLPDDTQYPAVYDYPFGYDTADYMGFSMKAFDPKKREFFSYYSDPELDSDGMAGTTFYISPDELHKLDTGLQKITVSISCQLETFFGAHAKNAPLRAKIEIPFIVPPVYRTTFYFKSFKFDEAGVNDALGNNNDYDDPTPEPGISVEYNGSDQIYEYCKNSYELNSKVQADIYHTHPDDEVTVAFYDHDYFLNSSDYLTERTFKLRDLEADTYQNYPFSYIEELWIYCRSRGRAN